VVFGIWLSLAGGFSHRIMNHHNTGALAPFLSFFFSFFLGQKKKQKSQGKTKLSPRSAIRQELQPKMDKPLGATLSLITFTPTPARSFAGPARKC